MEPLKRSAIMGGAIELAPSTAGVGTFSSSAGIREGSWTLSGRSALAVLLQSLIPAGLRRLVLPAYICQSVVQAAEEAGCLIAFYDISNSLEAEVKAQPGDAVLRVHYFGWPSLVNTNAEWIIEDFSQAVLSEHMHTNNHPAFFSLRKFSTTGIGGWCSTNKTLPLDKLDTAHQTSRLFTEAQQVKRLYLEDGKALVDLHLEQDYVTLFAEAERLFDARPEPVALPAQLIKQIEGEDWGHSAATRIENWQALHLAFNERISGLFTGLPEGVVPLGYLLSFPTAEIRNTVRKNLMQQGVFTAIHWPLPESVDQINNPGAVQLSNSVLTLPVDQRYTVTDMMSLADRVFKAVAA